MAVLVTKTTTKEGEEVSADFKIVKFGIDQDNANLPFFWPISIAHLMDKSSPLYGIKPEMIPFMNFELMIWVTGTSFSGGLVQACTSYLPKDIVWGGEFDFSTSFSEHQTHITLLGKQPSLQQENSLNLVMGDALDT